MTDKEIERLLNAYVDAEMSLIDLEDFDKIADEPSGKYKKRIKKLFSIEKYFGKNIRVGNAVRKAAIVAIFILSLIGANEVSAQVYGYNPWKYIMSFLKDSKMDAKRYTKEPNSLDKEEVASIIRDVPIQIPEGFEESSFKRDDVSLNVEWSYEEEHLQYSRMKISDGMNLWVDGEYQSKEKITINGFSGDYYIKGNETWIIWDDSCYNHMIIATGVENSKEILIKMAESLYK